MQTITITVTGGDASRDKMLEWKLASLREIVPIKVEFGWNLQIPKLRREVSNTENCSRPVFSAITGLRVTDLLLAQWLSGNLAGEIFMDYFSFLGPNFTNFVRWIIL